MESEQEQDAERYVFGAKKLRAQSVTCPDQDRLMFPF